MKLKAIPKYGDHGTNDVKILQEALGINADDWFGDETKKALQKLQKANGLRSSGIIGPKTLALLKLEVSPAEDSSPPPKSDNYFGAPWIGMRNDLLGRSEDDSALSEWLVPEWKKEGLNYKSLAGNTYAWCSVMVNACLRAIGVKPTNSAGAASWSKWENNSPFWFGAVLPIKHKSGGRHVCFFLYWIDETKKIAATKDGNRSNKYAICVTDLSGKGDTLVGGPRWSSSVANGSSPSMAQVLAKYPFLKVGNTGTSTR